MIKNTALCIMLIVVIGSIGFVALFSTTLIDSITEPKVITIAGTLDNYSMNDLAAGSKYALIGTVSEFLPAVNVTRSNGVSWIFTDVALDVEKDLHDQYDEKQITVPYPWPNNRQHQGKLYPRGKI